MYCQDIGWAPWNAHWVTMRDGWSQFGTTGESRRLEAIELGFRNNEYSGTLGVAVRYFDGSISKGTCRVLANGTAQYTGIVGTVGESKAIEAITIWLDGEVGDHYGIKYQVHRQDKGWPPSSEIRFFTDENNWAGSCGLRQRVEAIRIYTYKK